jgi:hypothetical protein
MTNPSNKSKYPLLKSFWGEFIFKKMNEGELIKEIVAEEARRRKIEAGKETGRGHKKVTLKSVEPLRIPKIATIVAKQVGLGGKDTYRKADKIWSKAKRCGFISVLNVAGELKLRP